MWERSINWPPLACTLTKDQNCSPGVCPDWESDLQPSGVQDDAEPHQPELTVVLTAFLMMKILTSFSALTGYLCVFFGEMSIQVTCPFLFGFSFYCWSLVLHTLWIIISYQVCDLQPFCRFTFHSVDNALWCTKGFNFYKVPFVYFFVAFTFGVKSTAKSKVIKVYSSEKFIILALILRLLIHLEFIFIYGVRCWSYFILIGWKRMLSQHHLLKRLLSHWLILAPCQKSVACRCLGWFLDSHFYSIVLFVYCLYARTALLITVAL